MNDKNLHRVQWLAKRMREAIRSGDKNARRRYERELVVLYQTEPALKHAVVEAFQPFALSFARKMKRGEEPLDDLIQVATCGLLKALDRFDPELGESFSGYAAPTVLGELRRHYRDTGWAVHVPRAKQELAQRIAKAARAVAHDGSEPTIAKIAQYLELTEEEVVEGHIAAAGLRSTSIDRPVDSADDGAATFADREGALDPGYERAEERAVIARLTADLPDRDRRVLALRYNTELSQREIGDQVGISQMQVSRELRRIVEQLQRAGAS